VASNASSEVYDDVGERGPGNPLFPTNFVRLALGPNLSAKYVPLLSSVCPSSAFLPPQDGVYR
jgi:hypothetical protein